MRAVLFDMDGVLIDTERLWIESLQVAFAEVDVELDEVDLIRARGTNGIVIVPELCKKYEISDWESLRKTASERFIAQWQDNSGLLPGAREAIAAAKQLGKVGIVTNSIQELLDDFLAKTNLEEIFDVAISGKTVGHFKPDPKIYQIACERIDVSPEYVIVLEDSTVGMQAALNAGCTVVAVGSHGNGLPVKQRIEDVSGFVAILSEYI